MLPVLSFLFESGNSHHIGFRVAWLRIRGTGFEYWQVARGDNLENDPFHAAISADVKDIPHLVSI
jgi:hypothetical protein